jgi:predicted MFS family arabinose efflux permease
MAGQRLVAMGAIPVGALLGGVLGDVVGYRETLGVAAAVMVLSIPVIVSSHIFGMRQLPGRRVGLRLDSDTNPVQA